MKASDSTKSNTIKGHALSTSVQRISSSSAQRKKLASSKKAHVHMRAPFQTQDQPTKSKQRPQSASRRPVSSKQTSAPPAGNNAPARPQAVSRRPSSLPHSSKKPQKSVNSTNTNSSNCDSKNQTIQFFRAQ